MRAMSRFCSATLGASAIAAVLCSQGGAVEAAEQAALPAAVLERLETIRLLKAENFKELEIRFAKVAAMAEANPSVDWNSVYTISAFDTADPGIVRPLNHWREAYPESFAPYLAFGLYSTHIGWTVRGSGTVRYTNAARFVEMKKYFGAATASLRTSLKYNPKIGIAWGELINIAKTTGDHRAVDTIFAEALTHVPKSSWVYGAYYDALAPKWGGSAAQQFALRLRMQSMFPGNPDFAWVATVEDREAAWNLYWNDKNVEALATFDDLIGRGDGSGSHRGRALSLRDLGKYEEAVAEFQRVVEMDPGDPEAYAELGEIQATKKEYWAAARRNMGIALMLDPYNPAFLVIRANFMMSHAKLNAAKRDLDNALLLGALDDRVRDSLRRYDAIIGDDKAAMAESENMLRLVPGNLNNLLSYGMAFFTRQDCRAGPVFERYLTVCRKLKECDEGQQEYVASLLFSIRNSCN